MLAGPGSDFNVVSDSGPSTAVHIASAAAKVCDNFLAGGEMSGLRVKPITQADLDDAVPNVGRAFSPRNTEGLSMNGSTHIIVPIDTLIANGIWEMMGMYKDHEKSAYHDVMAANRITLTINLFKVGKLLTTFYVANASISCYGLDKDFKVDFGSAAAERISLVVDRLVQLLMFKRPIASSTADALTEM